MSFNTFGKIFRFTTWGESHGPAIGCVVDGCPPNVSINEADIQKELNKGHIKKTESKSKAGETIRRKMIFSLRTKFISFAYNLYFLISSI